MFTRCLARPPTIRQRGKGNTSKNKSSHHANSKLNNKQNPSIPRKKFSGSIVSENSELQCPHFAECSGCTLETDIESPPIVHRAKTFFQETLGYQNFKLHAGNPHGWRHRARLAVRLAPAELFTTDQKLCVGLFKAGTHDPIDIPHCTVHHPALNIVADLIRSCIELCDISPYDEASGKGQLRYIQLALTDPLESKEEEKQEEREKIYAVQVVLVWNASNLETSLGLEDFAETLWLQAATKFALAVTATAATNKNERRRLKINSFSSSSSPSLLVALHSIHANFQPLKNNAILGPNTVLLHGDSDSWAHFNLSTSDRPVENTSSARTSPTTPTTPSSISYDGNNNSSNNIDNAPKKASVDSFPTTENKLITKTVPISFDPNSFMQANPSAMTLALESMRSWIRPGSNLVDLHAGVGTIGIALAATQNIASLKAVEINPSAEKSFWKSWRRLKKEEMMSSSSNFRQLPEKVEYFVAAAGSDPERWLDGADVAIVDPPRKGLEPELLEYLCCSREDGKDGGDISADQEEPKTLHQDSSAKEKKDRSQKNILPQRLLYLSCGFPAFERDAQRLVDSGKWKLVSAEAFLFFPGTDHIETLAVFDRI